MKIHFYNHRRAERLESLAYFFFGLSLMLALAFFSLLTCEAIVFFLHAIGAINLREGATALLKWTLASGAGFFLSILIMIGSAKINKRSQSWRDRNRR